MATPQTPPPSYGSLCQGGIPVPQGPPLPSMPINPNNYAAGDLKAPMGGYPQTTGAAAGPKLDAKSQPSQSSPASMTVPEAIQLQLQPPRQMQVVPTAPQIARPVNPNAPTECVLGSPSDHHVQMEPVLEHSKVEDTDGLSVGCVCWATWGIIAHVGFVVCIIILAIQVPLKLAYEAGLRDEETRADETENGPFTYNLITLICASVLLVVFYIVAIVESCLASRTSDYLTDVEPFADFYSNVWTTRKQVPSVILKAEAFHHGKQRIEWRNGVMTSRRNSDTMHKCVTYQESVVFPFTRCVDVSETLDNFKRGKIYRVDYGKTLMFLDAATKSEFKRQKQELIARVSEKDTQHSVETILTLPNMPKKQTTVHIGDDGSSPHSLSIDFYLCLVCIMCTWPYRIYFRFLTQKKKYAFVKLIGL